MPGDRPDIDHSERCKSSGSASGIPVRLGVRKSEELRKVGCAASRHEWIDIAERVDFVFAGSQAADTEEDHSWNDQDTFHYSVMFLFGSGPIQNSSLPPLAIAEKSNQLWFNGFPLRRTFWTYIFSGAAS